MNNKRNFAVDNKNLRIKEILNGDFLEIQVYSISEGDTRNRSAFTEDSLVNSLPSFYNKPILGAFSEQNDNDFNEHNSTIRIDKELDNEPYWSYLDNSSERILGFVRQQDVVKIEDYKGKKWIVCTAVIMCKYNREATKALLKSKKKKISVEIEVISSYFDERGWEIITDFKLDGITILGRDPRSGKQVEEGIEGAHLSILDEFLQSDLFNSQRQALQFAYNELEEISKENPDVNPIDSTVIKNMSQEEQAEDLTEVKLNDEGIAIGIDIPETETQEDVKSDFSDENNALEDETVKKNNIEENFEQKKEGEEEFSENEINVKDGDKMELTYGQKREILEAYLTENLKKTEEENENEICCCYVWVQDVSDTFVIFENEGTSYKANYIINEETKEVVVDLQSKEQVIRSWQVFIEENTAEVAEIPTEETLTTEVAETNTVQFVTIDEVEYDVNSLLAKYNLDIAQSTVQSITIDEVEYDIDGLLAKYNLDLADLNEVKSKLAELETEKFTRECKELFEVGCQMIDEEEELSEEAYTEDKEQMKATVKEKCESKDFTLETEVVEFVEDLLAKAVYKKLKEFKATKKAEETEEVEETKETKEFSAKLDVTVIPSETAEPNALEKLKKSMKKLKEVK